MSKKKRKNHKNKNYNIEEYEEYLPYCCNLDDHEYGLLWEFYEEPSIFDRLKDSIKGIFMFRR